MPPQGKDAKNKASSAAQAASKSGGKGGKKKVRPEPLCGVGLLPSLGPMVLVLHVWAAWAHAPWILHLERAPDVGVERVT